MAYPRFIAGSYGKLRHWHMNRLFDDVESLKRAQGSGSSTSRAVVNSATWLVKINGSEVVGDRNRYYGVEVSRQTDQWVEVENGRKMVDGGEGDQTYALNRTELAGAEPVAVGTVCTVREQYDAEGTLVRDLELGAGVGAIFPARITGSSGGLNATYSVEACGNESLSMTNATPFGRCFNTALFDYQPLPVNWPCFIAICGEDKWLFAWETVVDEVCESQPSPLVVAPSSQSSLYTALNYT